MQHEVTTPRQSEFLIALGVRLRKARMLKGLTLVEAGRLLGISFQQLQKYERGKNSISFQRLCDASRVYDVPVTAWLEDAAWPAGGSEEFNRPASRLLAAFLRLSLHDHRRLLCELAEALAGSPQERHE
jgi:transcriptional regulator with XRE-family HTH domain